MKHPKSASIRQLLETLRETGIEFIVVGGAAATMHGSGTTTEDLVAVYLRGRRTTRSFKSGC
jgi:hypothetical protein